jgi:hypothetical protein
MAKSLRFSGWIAGISILAVLGGADRATAQNKLEPTGPPAPTMKRLDEIPPTWSQRLPADDSADPCNSSRFKCVLPTFDSPTGSAVLDMETGLVWERSPESFLFQTPPVSWEDALYYCYNSHQGRRRGWRLPTIEELSSLIDPDASGTPRLPPNHPFSNVQNNYYWSSTTAPELEIYAYMLNVGISHLAKGEKDTTRFFWCVRGGHGHNS